MLLPVRLLHKQFWVMRLGSLDKCKYLPANIFVCVSLFSGASDAREVQPLKPWCYNNYRPYKTALAHTIIKCKYVEQSQSHLPRMLNRKLCPLARFLWKPCKSRTSVLLIKNKNLQRWISTKTKFSAVNFLWKEQWKYETFYEKFGSSYCLMKCS